MVNLHRQYLCVKPTAVLMLSIGALKILSPIKLGSGGQMSNFFPIQTVSHLSHNCIWDLLFEH
jgi:hypothetical protein